MSLLSAELIIPLDQSNAWILASNTEGVESELAKFHGFFCVQHEKSKMVSVLPRDPDDANCFEIEFTPEHLETLSKLAPNSRQPADTQIPSVPWTLPESYDRMLYKDNSWTRVLRFPDILSVEEWLQQQGYQIVKEHDGPPSAFKALTAGPDGENLTLDRLKAAIAIQQEVHQAKRIALTLVSLLVAAAFCFTRIVF